MSTIDISDVYDALQTGWERALSVDGVKVFSGPPGPEEAGGKFVHFGDGKQEVDQEASGRAREEVWKVEGEIVIAGASWVGSTEETIRAARNEARDILDRMRAYVAENYADGSYPDVEFTGGAIVQNYAGNRRQCGRRFELTVKFPTDP